MVSTCSPFLLRLPWAGAQGWWGSCLRKRASGTPLLVLITLSGGLLRLPLLHAASSECSCPLSDAAS